MSRARAAVVAVVASFAVYAVPLVGPHAVWLLGEALIKTIRREGLDPAWLATDLAAAAALQLAAGLVAYWVARRPRSARPVVALLVVVPTLVALTEWLYLVAIPTRFLIEPETAVEQMAWPIECRIPDRVLFNGGVPGAVWAMDSGGERARLIGCTVEPLPPIANAAAATPVSRATSGRLLLTRTARDGTQEWSWADPGQPAVALAVPAARSPASPAPRLSRDGERVVWVVSDGPGVPPPQALLVSALVGTDERRVSLAALPPGSIVPVEFDARAGEVTVALNERTFATLGLDGRVRWGPLRPRDVEPLSMTFRRVGGNGWIAWDGYRDDAPYRVAWGLPAGRGVYRVPKGRSIVGVDVDAAGTLIALSVSGTLSIGGVRDAVVVLRAADGGEVFRRFLPRYTRTAVTFLDGGRFAYTDWVGDRAEVRVLRIATR